MTMLDKRWHEDHPPDADAQLLVADVVSVARGTLTRVDDDGVAAAPIVALRVIPHDDAAQPVQITFSAPDALQVSGWLSRGSLDALDEFDPTLRRRNERSARHKRAATLTLFAAWAALLVVPLFVASPLLTLVSLIGRAVLQLLGAWAFGTWLGRHWPRGQKKLTS